MIEAAFRECQHVVDRVVLVQQRGRVGRYQRRDTGCREALPEGAQRWGRGEQIAQIRQLDDENAFHGT